MKRDIRQKWFFQRPPSEVWEYLTKPELIEQWLMKTDFKPITGYKFRFTHTPKEGSKYAGIVNCEVLEVNPFSRLSYTWDGATKDGRSFNSKVEWILVPKEDGTELQLVHDGFVDLEDFTAHQNGWKSCLEKFEALIITHKS